MTKHFTSINEPLHFKQYLYTFIFHLNPPLKEKISNLDGKEKLAC